MKTALVTGVTGGIGRATAEAFASSGWQVVGIDARPAEPQQAVARFVQLDLAAPQAETAIVELVDGLDRLDAVINNAGVQIKKPMSELSLAEWDLLFAINVRAAFVTSRASFAQLARTRGSIVNVASVHAIASVPGMAGYAATKAALVALTRAAALEFGPAGVRVNAVLPGAIDTAMLRAGLVGPPEAALDQLRRRTPLGRIGSPAEVAQAIVFLADSASFVTGQALVVDGGVLARLASE